MIFLYSVLFILLIALSAIFYKHKNHIKAGISFKSNPLSVFYGLSFFIIDFLKISDRKIRKESSSAFFSSARKKALMLNPGKDSEQLLYLSLAKSISLCICVFIIFMILGIVYTFNNIISGTSYVNSLKRPTDGSENITYSLQVNTEETTEYIDIEVSKKMYEYSEVIALFDKYREDIVAAMLNDNKSTDKITSSLTFISSIGDENILLTWQPEDTSYIDLNGNLIYDNISSTGTDTTIYVYMEFNDITASLAIGVTLYQPSDSSVTLKKEIQDYIDNNSNPVSTSVSLPSRISGNSLTFSFPRKNVNYIFLLLAFVSSLLMYILTSKETDKQLKLRNRQLMQDYPHIVSKLLLLCNAGLNIQNALKKIAEDYRHSGKKMRYAYEELLITLNSLSGGKSQPSAYRDYGKRCGIMPYIKLGVLLEQNIQKGTKELHALLDSEVKNAFENHKSETITLSKQAETKLIFPMIIILIVIMALIMIPTFMNI